MADAKRDENFVPTLLGVSSVDGSTPVAVYANPVTHRVLVDLSGGGSGTVTDLSVVSANGFAGTVATSTTTPAITLTTTITGILSGNGTAISAASTTGSGAVVLANTPTLITPVLGAATGTSLQLSGLTASEIVITDASKNLASAAVATYPSLTELTYLKGVTSAIQTQLNAKGTVTAVSSANTDIGVATGTTTPVLTLNSSTTATADKVVKRDASANTYSNNYFANTASTVSAAGTTVLTVASARTQNLTGSSTQTFQLPDATTLPLSSIFDFNNNSSAALTITNAGAASQYVVPAGGAVTCFCTSIGSANGTWDFHAQAPAAATWGSGVVGLVMNSVLTTSPSVGSGASSATAPSFIPQRGAATTGFGGDGTNLFATVGGTAYFKVASGSISPNANDATALGTTALQFSDLFLAEGGVINWDNGDATLTQVGDVVTLAGADLKVTTPGTAATSVATIDGTQTLTNKRIQPRTASSTTSATLTPDVSTANVYYRTTQTETLTIGAPTGTPVIGETILIYVDSAGAQTLTINATYKVFGAAFPATSTAGKTFMMSCQYNGTDWKTLWANAV